MIHVWYSRWRAPNFVLHLETTQALFAPCTLVHLWARTSCRKTTWARKGIYWRGETATGGWHNCTSSPFSFTDDCCSFKIPCYIFNCGHLGDCLLLLRYCWILLSMWPQDKANNYQHQKQLVVLYYIEVNYTGIRVDYFYQMGNKLLINSLL